MESSRLSDSAHHHGNFWFGGGYIPDTHVVGKPYLSQTKQLQKAMRERLDATGSRSAEPSSGATERRSETETSAPHYHDISGFLQNERRAQQGPDSQKSPSRRVGHTRTPPPQDGPAHYHDISSYLQSQQPHAKTLPSPLTAPRAQTPTPGRTINTTNSTTATPPFAEHYPVAHRADTPSRILRLDASNTSTGLPRGYGGVDAIPAAARQAQRNIEAMQTEAHQVRKQLLQRQLKEDLDRQLQEKHQQKLREWEEEAVAVYGPALARDDRLRKMKSKQTHAALQQVWKAQAAEAAARKAYEEQYYKPYEENWNDMKDNMDRLRRDDPADRIRHRQSSWLEAWKDHQAAEGAKRKAAVEELYRQEYFSISPNIANYSDRILLAEQQKKMLQAQYHDALASQIAQKEQNKREQWQQEYEESIYGPQMVTSTGRQ